MIESPTKIKKKRKKTIKRYQFTSSIIRKWEIKPKSVFCNSIPIHYLIIELPTKIKRQRKQLKKYQLPPFSEREEDAYVKEATVTDFREERYRGGRREKELCVSLIQDRTRD